MKPPPQTQIRLEHQQKAQPSIPQLPHDSGPSPVSPPNPSTPARSCAPPAASPADRTPRPKENSARASPSNPPSTEYANHPFAPAPPPKLQPAPAHRQETNLQARRPQ